MKADDLLSAHYYFATMAMQEATAGRDDQFIGLWLAKIRETAWNRTSGKTVMDAYEALTGMPLESMIPRATAGK